MQELTLSPAAHEVLNEALQTFGHDSQCLKAVEELTELAAALSKKLNKKRFNPGIVVFQHDVISEIADCHIMLTQLIKMLDGEQKKLFQQIILQKIFGLRNKVKLLNP